jgi:hypothetical protein
MYRQVSDGTGVKSDPLVPEMLKLETVEAGHDLLAVDFLLANEQDYPEQGILGVYGLYKNARPFHLGCVTEDDHPRMLKLALNVGV